MQRLKKILKWTGIVLGVLLAIVLVANASFVWTTDARLARQLAAIRAAGDPVTLADLARPPIPHEKNAATYLHQANADVEAILDVLYPPSKNPFVKALVETIQREVPKSHGETKIPMNVADLEAMSTFDDKEWDESYAAWLGNPPRSLMPPRIQKVVKTTLAKYPKAIPLLEQAVACPAYDAQLDYTLPPEKLVQTQLSTAAQDFRSSARVLECRAYLLMAEGNRDEAVRTGLAIFRLARQLGSNPTAICYLPAITIQGCAVATINDALQAGPVSKEIRDRLDAELAFQERADGYAWMIKSERAFFLESFPTVVPGRNLWLVGRGFWNLQESDCLNMFQTFLALASDPSPYRQNERTMEGKIPGPVSFVARSPFPAFKVCYKVATQIRAMIRCLRVLNALQTQVPAGSNEAPKLAELGLPAETITDPFTGEPLHVKKTPQGWLVYSVGSNFQDDGGKVDDPTNGDVGIGPPPPAAKPAENEQEKKAEK